MARITPSATWIVTSMWMPVIALLAAGISPLAAPQAPAAYGEAVLQHLDESGQITIEGHPVPYLIRHLPIDSFPGVPANVQAELTRRDCLIPQTYEAHQPENVIHGSFERPGSSDWAALCSAHGTVSLLVFFASRPGEPPFVLATAPETERLQSYPAGSNLGFNWGIDSASPQMVHDAQAGLDPRPAMIDHDALADSTVDRRTVYHFYAKGTWTLLDMPLP